MYMIMRKCRLFYCLTVFFTLLPLVTSRFAFSYENKNVHPYIAEEAFFVWPNDISHEIYEYLENSSVETSNCLTAKIGSKIKEGAEDEDEYDPVNSICVNPLSA